MPHRVNIHNEAGHSFDPAERHEHFKHIFTKGHPQDVLPGMRPTLLLLKMMFGLILA